MIDPSKSNRAGSDASVDRRGFVSGSWAAMAAGLLASYGTLLATAGRFLYPAAAGAKIWMFVAELDAMQLGDSLEFQAPTGAKIVIARQGVRGKADDFVALSSVCPHLGCRVEWQPQNNRFYCPCHNGVFNPQGKATGGPPAAAGQSLFEYPLRVENGLLFIKVPVEGVGGPAGG